MKRNHGALLRTLAALFALLTLCVCFASCEADYKGNGFSEDYNGAFDEELKEPSEGSGLQDSNQSLSTNVPERKVIKTFDIQSETKDFDAAIQALNTLISDCGGYVESASSTDKSLNNSSTYYARYATYTVRIPAENAECFVGSVGDAFHITSNRSYVEDVSETYYSIEARLEELQIERDSLMDILDLPETKQDYTLWTTVQSRLSEVRQQIAVYQGQLNRYDSRVAYSTVNLSIHEVINYTEGSEDNSFGSRLAASFQEGWNDFTEGLQEFVIWFAGAIPFLLTFAVIAGIVIVIILATTRKKKR